LCHDAQNNKPPRHSADENVPANPLRTSSIFHFTRSLDSLIGILSEGLIPNYCSETLYDKDGINITLGIPMVSFCDIPLSRTYEHTERYGTYAIGLGTEYAEDNGINPLLYVSNDQLIRDAFPDIFSGKYAHGSHRPISHFPSSYLGLLKRMYGEFKDVEISNYAENEWRYIVSPGRGRGRIKWFHSKEEYMQWRGDVEQPKPLPSPELVSRKLTFTAKYVNHIIVEHESDIPPLVKFLCISPCIGGSYKPLSDRDLTFLLTHITSFERIRRDY
jgi:hypothetical protein